MTSDERIPDRIVEQRGTLEMQKGIVHALDLSSFRYSRRNNVIGLASKSGSAGIDLDLRLHRESA